MICDYESERDGNNHRKTCLRWRWPRPSPWLDRLRPFCVAVGTHFRRGGRTEKEICPCPSGTRAFARGGTRRRTVSAFRGLRRLPLSTHALRSRAQVQNRTPARDASQARSNRLAGRNRGASVAALGLSQSRAMENPRCGRSRWDQCRYRILPRKLHGSLPGTGMRDSFSSAAENAAGVSYRLNAKGYASGATRNRGGLGRERYEAHAYCCVCAISFRPPKTSGDIPANRAGNREPPLS